MFIFKSKRRRALEQKHRASHSSKSRNGDAEVKCRKFDNVAGAGAERKEFFCWRPVVGRHFKTCISENPKIPLGISVLISDSMLLDIY